MQCLATAKIKTGVMPGATYGVVRYQTIGKRAVIMGAMGGDRENIRAAPDQQHLVFADTAGQHSVFRKRILRNTLGEIGTVGFGVVFAYALRSFGRLRQG